MAVEVFPVIHVRDSNQAIEQSDLAFESGANGVYLIDHNSPRNTRNLVDSYNEVASKFVDRFVGINFLQHSSAAYSLSFIRVGIDTGSLARLPDGLWADDADIDKEQLIDIRLEHPELAAITYLGGVAFKYTPYFTNDSHRAADEAVRLQPFIDVVVTSGEGTGQAPPPEKIKAMKTAIQEAPLAVASGISTENIHNYIGYFDQLLVSTSIETKPYSGVFDPRKLKDLIDLAHSS